MYMTRRLTFSAALADWLPSLSRADNEALFGPNASPDPYGHNFVLDVEVEGGIDARTGILVNIKEIDRLVKAQVIQRLDKKFINRQVPAFCEHPVTLENLAAYIAGEIAPHLPAVVTLSGLRLEATTTHYVEWLASEKPRGKKAKGAMLLTRIYEFSASHRLHSPHLSDAENQELFGKCNYENGHGHNYELEVTVAGPVEARTGHVLRQEALDAVVQREVVDRYDHRHLNFDIPEFAGLIPSAEIITKTIWQRLEAQIPDPAHLYRVRLRETARNLFETYGED